MFLLYICVDFELGTLDDLHSFCLTVAVYLILLAKMCFLLIEEKKKKSSESATKKLKLVSTNEQS